MLTVGITKTLQEYVTEEKTAKVVGSGSLMVYATPAMITLMEKTSAMLVEPFLADGEGTVGISVNIKHISATPVSMNVTCNSELVEIDKKRLAFKVEAFDEKGKIGEGTHERFIINNDRFMEKVNTK